MLLSRVISPGSRRSRLGRRRQGAGRRYIASLYPLAAIALAILAGATCQARAQTHAVLDFAGVYASPGPLLNARRSIEDGVYQSDASSGVYVRLVWSQVEPQRGRYDFSLLDAELSRAVKAKRRISISLIAGGFAPRWLASSGVRTAAFQIGRGGANRSCVAIEMGVPWDPAFQDAYLKLWQAVAARIRERNALDLVRIVKLTGVNRITEELRLPGTAGQTEDVCGRTDDADIWRRQGYKPQLVVDAWKRIADGIGRTFPDRLLALDILERNDFPPIGDDGKTVDAAPVKARIIDTGFQAFAGRFSVQWNGLTAAGPLAETVLEAGKRGAVVGWQSNAFRGLEGAGCNTQRRASSEPCDEPGFDAILQRGIATGGAYIEVWTKDVLRFPSAVAAADRAMRAKFDRASAR